MMIDENNKIFYREDMEYKLGHLTIERQLHLYEKHPEKSERAATLWHAWQQNKQWLIRLLELTLASFPSYSRHDASHADAVLHNIERVMGEKRIAELSATDCFAILHTVYIHDIGMAILAEDRIKIIKSDGFVEMVDELSEGADKDLRNAAILLKKTCYGKNTDEEIDFDSVAYHDSKKKLYIDKLETYYAVVQLLAEYQRRVHGDKAATDVKDWIFDKDKLRAEFTMSGVPMRIFFRIADCARLHTDWEFNHILELPSEENGYENDMLHPRFVAVMLQLGDALDIDNDRFHPFAHEFAGHFPEKSQSHYSKHLAIRTLKITPEEIVIEADCETREAMRLIKNECDGIENLLKSASYYWSSIAPKGFSGALPSFQLARLRLNEKKIPWDLALTRFQISQQKAFSFLQGENIYSGYFPFVRELLQNAIDSTKLQCYEDYKTSSKFRFKDSRKGLYTPGIINISRIINPVEYPIEISIQCCKLNESDEYEEIDFKNILQKEDGTDRYGILFSIKDYGTGINTETLRNISDVGTSYKSRKKLLREIPDWLRPTGEFGIGLQSVFLVSDNFFCDTYVRNGECYRIEFLTGANGKNGYINVEPKDPAEKPMTYGTEFQVFIRHDKKKERQEFMDAWTGYDPFARDYEESRIRRDIIALTTQILLDIDSQLEDLLFPVYVSVKFDLGEAQRKLLKSKLTKIVFDNLAEDNYTEENLRKHMCWIYQNTDNDNSDGSIIRFEIEQGVCRVDLTQMKIYLWLNDLSVNACIGVDHVANDNFQSIQSSYKLYYKGILIDDNHVNNSGNLLEYINIQGGRNGRKLIQLSRNGFTTEGENYVNTVLIPRIYKNLFEVLKTLANQRFDSGSGNETFATFSEKIMGNIQRALTDKKEYPEKGWQKQLIGTSLYYNFYMRELERKKSIYLSRHGEEEKEQWNRAIRNVSEAVRERRNDTMDEIHSALIVIEVYADLESREFTVLDKKEITIADFYNKENKFAVVSKRRDKGDKWINSLICLKNTEKTDEETEEKEIYPPALVEVLERTITERMRWDDMADYMEEWSNFMLDNIDGILEPQPIQQSNFVLALLQSVSISACFADVTGNLKIHILSGKPLGSVFYNIYAKYGLLKKIARRKQRTNAVRFSGNVWMGYEPLQTYEIQEDICNIKEQYIQQGESQMIFPCSGEAARNLVRIAEMEEETWNRQRQEEEIDIYLRETKNMLAEMAEMLYSCIVIKYVQVRSIDADFFRERYALYCRRERVRISEASFWDLLNSGYSLLLGNMFRDELRKSNCKKERNSWKKISAEKLKKQVEIKLPDKEIIKMLNGLIGISILESSDSIIGEVELSRRQGKDLKIFMEQLIGCCLNWEWLWNLVEHLQVEREIQGIKECLSIDSAENANLTVWISRQADSDQHSVAECYDRMWDDLIKAALWQRRERFAEKHHFKLLDWMRKKEENME